MWNAESVMNITKNPVVFCLLILVLSINACGGLTRSDKPATKTWWLEPTAGIAQEKPSTDVLLVAISVTAVPGLDTDRILTLSDDAQLNQFAAARWADNLPELVTSLTGRSLQASGRFEVVSDRTKGVSEDCNLQLELREFFALLKTSGQTRAVQVAIDGHYQCDSAAAVVLHLDASIPVNDNRISVIVAAFQQAMDSVITKLAEQL